jgi:hypothetical protein
MNTRICKTVIFSVVLDGWVTWPFTLEEEHRPRVFENMVLSKIFGERERKRE